MKNDVGPEEKTTGPLMQRTAENSLVERRDVGMWGRTN